MTVIDTSTSTTPTGGTNGRKTDRNQDGTLWAAFESGLPATELWYSKDGGATWLSGASDVAGATNAALFIDLDDFAHLVFKQSGTAGGRTTGNLYYTRGTPNVGRTSWTWATPVALASVDANYPDLCAHREGTGWVAHVVYSKLSTSGSASYTRVTTTSGGVSTAGGSVSYGNSSVAAHTYPSIDFHHTGDGKTVAGAAPHVYIVFIIGAAGVSAVNYLGVNMIKHTYSAGAWTAGGGGIATTIDGSRYVTAATNTWLTGFYDGTRFVMAGWLYTGTQFDLIQYERNEADTTTTTRVLAANTSAADTLASGSATWDVDSNVYLLGRDGTGSSGSRKLNYRKWTRSGATLGATAAVETTASDTPAISARRGTGGTSIDIVYTDGTASPYSVTFVRVLANTTNLAPQTPGLTVTSNAAVGKNVLTWTQPTPVGAQPAVASADVYRRVGATGAGTRLRAAETGLTWTDGRIANRVDYQYLVRALGVNGVTADSAWTS